MPIYHHILLATDLSEKADIVVNAARTLAIKFHAKLSIIHVLEHTPIVYGGGEFSIPIDMNLEEQLAQNTKKALAVLGSRFDISPEDQYIAHGSIKGEIIDLGEKLKVDLIVVGSHGQSKMEFLLGSTANALLHAAKCDVLAVRVSTNC